MPGRVDDRVRAFDEPPPQRAPVGALQVERDAALARVEMREAQRAGRGGPIAGERTGAARARARRRLDPDHVRAGVGQQLARDLAEVADLDDAQALGADAHTANSSCSAAISSGVQPSSASSSSVCSPSSGAPRRSSQPSRAKRNGSVS